MAKPTPVRLEGQDHDIVKVAQLARAAIARDEGFSRSVLPSIASLGRTRREHVKTADSDVSAPSVAAPPQASPMRQTLWSVVFGVGLVGATVSAALVYPPIRRIVVEPAIAVPVLIAASIVAIAALAIALVVRSSPRSAAAASVLAVIVALAVVAGVGYRVVVGTSGGTPYTGEQLAWWFAAAALILVELTLLVIRLRRMARHAEASAGVRWSGSREYQRETARLHAYAKDLAATAPKDAPSRERLRADWDAALSSLDAVALQTLEQARALGPVAWLVWAAYDGELDISRVRLG